MTMRFNHKAEPMNDIMLVCNQFKEVKRTVRPTNCHWSDFIGYENGTSTVVVLVFS